MQEAKSSVLTLESQKKLSFTGVESVVSLSETLILLTVAGKRVRIEGARLKVLSFSEGSGNFSASGEIRSIRFLGAKGNLFSRLFK